MSVPWWAPATAVATLAASRPSAMRCSMSWISRSGTTRGARDRRRGLAGAGRIANRAVEFQLVGGRAEVFEPHRTSRGLDEGCRQRVHALGLRQPRCALELRFGEPLL